MTYELKESGKYSYVDEGEGQTLLVLHGLFGALSNFNDVLEGFKDHYRVLIPLMPIYDMPMRQASLEGLLSFIEGFVEQENLKDMVLLGNSLGGHVALMYSLAHPSHVSTLILTGSSGLFENTMGGSFPKRGNYDYIKERVEYTFYDPKTATKDLVDECFDITSSIPKCMNNMANEIQVIKAPTCLIWGLNDTITPPHVGHEFNRLIPNSELYFIDKCGHAPMMEQPKAFNEILQRFLVNSKKKIPV